MLAHLSKVPMTELLLPQSGPVAHLRAAATIRLRGSSLPNNLSFFTEFFLFRTDLWSQGTRGSPTLCRFGAQSETLSAPRHEWEPHPGHRSSGASLPNSIIT